MAGDLSNYAEGKLYDHLLGRSAFTMPGSVYLALFTAVTDAEAGTGTEVAVAGYARQVCAMGAMTPGTDAPGSNTGTLTFGPLTGGAGTATHAALLDAVSGGNPLTCIKALAVARAWLAGDSIVFNPGDVTFSLT